MKSRVLFDLNNYDDISEQSINSINDVIPSLKINQANTKKKERFERAINMILKINYSFSHK